MPACTSPTLHPPYPPTVLKLSCLKLSQCINCRDEHFKTLKPHPMQHLWQRLRSMRRDSGHPLSTSALLLCDPNLEWGSIFLYYWETANTWFDNVIEWLPVLSQCHKLGWVFQAEHLQALCSERFLVQAEHLQALCSERFLVQAEHLQAMCSERFLVSHLHILTSWSFLILHNLCTLVSLFWPLYCM